MIDTIKQRLRVCFHKCPKGMQRALISLRGKLKAFSIKRRCRYKFKDLRGRTALKVHLGCGEDIRPGWVNVDALQFMVPGFDPNAIENAIFVNHDLSSGLPLPNNSCQYIYSSHFFEHLEYQQGLNLMRDCFRALQKGGVFRFVLPDFKAAFEAYINNDASYFALLEPSLESAIEPDHKTLVDYINYGVYQFGEHKCIYDQIKLERLLRSIGFKCVVASSFQSGVDLDIPLRRQYSFYVEAIKS